MYELIFKTPAERFLKKFNKETQKQILNRLKKLKNNPKLGKPLVGNLSGLWSLKFGNYRAIYQIKHQELLIFVLKIGHRKNVYG